MINCDLSVSNGGPGLPRTEDKIGMTLRDYFAAAALQGLLSNPKLQQQILKQGGAESGWIESSAYGWADGMLKARDEPRT